MAVKRKHSHIFTADQQATFIAYALKCGNVPETTTELRRKFGLNRTQAYYYRRLAFGFRRGVHLPIRVAISADHVNLVDKVVESGIHPNRSDAIESAIDKTYGGTTTSK